MAAGLLLYIRPVAGEVVSVEVPATATVGDVVEEYARLTGRPSSGIGIGTGAGRLDPAVLLADAGIGAETELQEDLQYLKWHPDHLPRGSAAPVAPTKLLLQGPGTPSGGTVLSATTTEAGEEVFAALDSTYEVGANYRSPAFCVEKYNNTMAFGLHLGTPTENSSFQQSECILLVDVADARCVSGAVFSAQDGEPDLKVASPFRLLIDEQLRLTWELHSGSPQQSQLPARAEVNEAFAQQIRKLPSDAVIHPFVFTWCAAGAKWTVVP
eukprot:TRINITY_DN62241_c0_g1_i1.p1 TRINITY_DN62241_c0_g1~~TRINITY_DN62241_c0_g1_i1.p1  ORF type:complete len:295 (+),score=56.50 TRINITY_DN62241_c0_g1_i1:80-886(+)